MGRGGGGYQHSGKLAARPGPKVPVSERADGRIVAAVVVVVALASAARPEPGQLAQAAWLVCLHLWFLPTYLLVIALTPVMLAAHRRPPR